MGGAYAHLNATRRVEARQRRRRATAKPSEGGGAGPSDGSSQPPPPPPRRRDATSRACGRRGARGRWSGPPLKQAERPCCGLLRRVQESAAALSSISPTGVARTRWRRRALGFSIAKAISSTLLFAAGPPRARQPRASRGPCESQALRTQRGRRAGGRVAHRRRCSGDSPGQAASGVCAPPPERRGATPQGVRPRQGQGASDCLTSHTLTPLMCMI